MVERGTLGGQASQKVPRNNTECLEYLYISGDYSDVDIVFPKDGVCIKAHRVILSMKSPTFGTMLMGPMAAGKQVTLPEDPLEIFRKLLDHTYLDRMDLESVEEALEVYALAHKYLMEPARKACLQYILSNLKEETTLAALEISVAHEDKELNDKCKEMLCCAPDAVMLSETVCHLSKETLRDLLRDDDIGFSSEVIPFKGLIAWGKAQLDQEEEPSGSAVREKIGDLLKEVRFLDMSCDEFVNNVFDTNVLTHMECFHIQRAINGADLSTLPKDTPLGPTGAGRAPKPRKREELSPFLLYFGPGSWDKYTSSSEVYLTENILGYGTVEVHHMAVVCGHNGTINIMDSKGKTVRSATSEDNNFTFARPAVLQTDKEYRVVFYPRNDVELWSGQSKERERARKAVLSCSRGHYILFYIWKPTSS